MAKIGRPKLELKVQHEAKELKAAYRLSTDAVERRRIQAVWLLAEGKSRDEVRAVTAYAVSSLVMIIERYNEAGLGGLKDKRHDNPGLAPLLSEAEQKALYEALQKPPEEGGVWSGKKVAAWVGEHTGKLFHVQRGCEYLKRLGFSLQRPRPRHRQADGAAQEDFKKTPWPSA
jgi:transposase